MNGMREDIKKKLIDLFGERVAFHRVERLLYASDLASLPKMITDLIRTVPNAIVQPLNGEELSSLIKLAVTDRIPLTPRGAASAGYGGAVPAKGGIVVDFSRMNKIVYIDTEKKTVTIEPGVIWNKLEKELRTHDLALRLYPGSAISATVGGWIANGGGIGIGGFEYGYLKDNILELELITPMGTQKIDGASLDFVEGMAGTTGFISRVTLLVRKAEKDIPVVAAFASFEALVHTFTQIRQKNLPLWEVGYKDSLNVELTGKAIAELGLKGPLHHATHEAEFPHKYLATYVYPESRKEKIEKELLSIITDAGGEVLSKELADVEWSERFYGMRLKALGPSTVPSEVIIPTERLSEFVQQVNSKVKDLAFNGTLVAGGKEGAFLGCRLDDERRRGYALAFVNSFVPIQAAGKLGGRPYTIGMLLSNYAVSCIGKERLEKAYEFKKKVDPKGIMNPGKVFPASLDKASPTKTINFLSKIAATQISAIKAFDALFGGKPQGLSLNDNTPIASMPFGKELAWDAFACANCGYCRADCTEYRAIGWESASPRGKFRFLREYLKGNIDFDERMAEMFFACSTCGHCNDVCQVRASIDEHWSITVRPLVWRQGFNPPSVHQGNAHNVMVHHNPPGISQSERTAWMTPDLKYKQEGEIAYFAGCSASFSGSTRNLAVNAIRISRGRRVVLRRFHVRCRLS
jgi:FAD/FMN-containing dehydrogenase/ferredoxin